MFQKAHSKCLNNLFLRRLSWSSLSPVYKVLMILFSPSHKVKAGHLYEVCKNECIYKRKGQLCHPQKDIAPELSSSPSGIFLNYRISAGRSLSYRYKKLSTILELSSFECESTGGVQSTAVAILRKVVDGCVWSNKKVRLLSHELLTFGT